MADVWEFRKDGFSYYGPPTESRAKPAPEALQVQQVPFVSGAAVRLELKDMLRHYEKSLAYWKEQSSAWHPSLMVKLYARRVDALATVLRIVDAIPW